MRRLHRHAHRCVIDRLEGRTLLSYGFGAPGDGVLSLTFLGDKYPLTSAGTVEFQADIQTCVDALKTIEPFNSRFGQFEFHNLPLGPSLGISWTGSNPSADYATVDQLVVASGITTDIAVVLVDYDFPGGTGQHQIPALTNGMGMPGVFLHELAHSMGTSGDPESDAYYLLWDEYVYSWLGSEPHDGLTHQNIYAGDPAGGAPDKWAGLVAPDEYTLGATYPNWYRPSPRSIMVHSAFGYFNAVSHQLVGEGMDHWAGPFHDAVAPTVAFATLHSGDTVSGAVPIATTITDNQGVAFAQLWVDGQLARNAYQAPFTLDWTTGSTVPGAHTLQVKAFDAAGNVGLSPLVHVNLVNPADISITSPAAGSTVGSTLNTGAFHVAVNAWDEALDSVLVWVDDDKATAKRAYTGPYAVDLSTSGLTPGAHTLHAVGYSFGTGAARYETSIPFTFEALAAAIAAPAADAKVGGTVPVVIDVTQGRPDRIELKYANRSGSETTIVDTEAPWVFSWDTSTAPNDTVGLFVTLHEGTGTVWLPARIVQVQNGYGKVEAPASGATVDGTVTATFNAYRYVSQVDLLIDGKRIDSASLPSGNGYRDFTWDTRTVANGGHTLTFRATNAYGWSQDYSVAVTVQNVVVTNHAPKIAPIGLKTVPEGSTIAFRVEATDQDAGQQLIHVLIPPTPSSGSLHPLTGDLTYTALVAPGWYTGRVLVADTGTPQLYDIATFGIEVTNVAPRVELPVSAAGRRGQPLGVPGSFTDPGQGPWTLVINYGDGSPVELAPTWSKTFVVGHTYARRGTFPLTVAAVDQFGGVDIKKSTVTVGLGTTTVTAAVPVVSAGKVTHLVIAFSDPLNAGRAQATRVYEIKTAGRDRRLGTRDDQTVSIRSATYVPDGRAVVLTLGAPIPTTTSYRVRVRATSAPTHLINALGQLLDGDANDSPGGDFIRSF